MKYKITALTMGSWLSEGHTIPRSGSHPVSVCNIFIVSYDSSMNVVFGRSINAIYRNTLMKLISNCLFWQGDIVCCLFMVLMCTLKTQCKLHLEFFATLMKSYRGENIISNYKIILFLLWKCYLKDFWCIYHPFIELHRAIKFKWTGN